MYIESIFSEGFRNLYGIDLKLNKGINIFYGNNAQGKTNILETVYVCGTGRSHRTRIDSRLVNFNGSECHVRIFCVKGSRKDRIDLHIKKDERKGIAVNGIPIKKSSELFGTLLTVIFSPEDLGLVKDGPSERRRFMDMELCQMSNVYCYDLQQYYKVLKQRNSLLKNIQKNPSLKETIFVWDNQLEEYGKRLISARRNFISKLNDISAIKHKKITGEGEILKIEYKPDCKEDNFHSKLLSSIERDIMYGTTSQGPHKDDIIFTVNDCDVKLFGSQGQQRTVSLSTRLAEIDIIENETGEKPVVLLDDVFSELDESRQKFLLESIKDTQIILTCTGVEDVVKKYIKNASIFYVENGKVIKKTCV